MDLDDPHHCRYIVTEVVPEEKRLSLVTAVIQHSAIKVCHVWWVRNWDHKSR